MSRVDNNYYRQGGYYYPKNQDSENPTGYYYKPRGQESAEFGWVLASVASGLVYKLLPSFSNPFLKQMGKEHANNHLYKDAFIKAVDNSGLIKKGLRAIHIEDASDIGKGFNACFIPATKEICLNKNLATISGFHELGHAMNNMKPGIGRFLQKLRKPGYTIAALMGTVALFSRSKPKDAERNPLDFVQDNCGKIAFAAMLPTVIEESMASYKGVQAAKKAGLAKPLIQNLKKFYGKALLSYGGYAVITGVATFAASKIMEKFTRPKKVMYDQF